MYFIVGLGIMRQRFRYTFARTISYSEWNLLKDTLNCTFVCWVPFYVVSGRRGDMHVSNKERVWECVCMCACSLHNAAIVIGNLQRGCDWILHYFSRFCHVENVWTCLIAEDPISHSCWVTLFNFGRFSWCCFCSPCLLVCVCMC